MGIFGADTRKIGDKLYQKQVDFADPAEAKHWADVYRQHGYPAQVVPDASHTRFDLFVCVAVIPKQDGNPNVGMQKQQ